MRVILILFLVRTIYADIPCNNPIPGLSRLAQGIDLTKVDIFHDYTVSNDDGFAHIILAYHCTQNRTWTSPFDNTTYQIPDEVENVVSLPSGLIISDVKMESTTHQVKESMAEEVGIGLTFGKGSFSASWSYQEAHNTLTNKSSYLARGKAFISINEIDLIPPPFLNSSLNRYIRYFIDNELPAKYEDNPAKYMEFFQTYGTHYFERANFGGTLTIWTQIQNYLKTVMNEERTAFNVQATFLKILQAHGAYNDTVNQVDEVFKQHSHHSERYFGGVANLFDSKGYTTWWPTVARNPWLYSGTLQPITDLIMAPKKDQLVKASQVYFDYSYLRELRTDLYSIVAHNKSEGETHTALQFIDEINNMTSIHDHNTLKSLYENIESFVNGGIPYWFRHTSLCSSDGSKDYCATVSETTQPFPPCRHINNSLICDLSLKFIPSSVPEWFNQISFSKSSDHTNVSYCYKFKMNVPVSAPDWLHNMQLCYFAHYLNNVTYSSCVAPNVWTNEHCFRFPPNYDEAYFRISPHSTA